MNIPRFYSENEKTIKLILLLFAALIIFDQFTKIIARNYFENAKEMILIPGILSLKYHRNEIVYFHQYVIYFLINILVMPAAVVYSLKKKMNRFLIFGMVVLWSAVFSNNIIDASVSAIYAILYDCTVWPRVTWPTSTEQPE